MLKAEPSTMCTPSLRRCVDAGVTANTCYTGGAITWTSFPKRGFQNCEKFSPSENSSLDTYTRMIPAFDWLQLCWCYCEGPSWLAEVIFQGISNLLIEITESTLIFLLSSNTCFSGYSGSNCSASELECICNGAWRGNLVGSCTTSTNTYALFALSTNN